VGEGLFLQLADLACPSVEEGLLEELLEKWRNQDHPYGSGLWFLFPNTPIDQSFLVEEIRRQSPLGLVFSFPSSDPGERLLHVVLRQAITGNGFGTEAAKALMQHIFLSPSFRPRPSFRSRQFPPPDETNNVKSFLSLVETASPKSIAWARVLEKLGFKQLSTKGVFYDRACAVYSLSRDDFVDLWCLE